VNRKKSTLSVQVYDWDQIGSHDILGETKVPIDELESFAAQEIELPVDQEGGTIHLRLKWEPQLLARKRMATSLLGSTTRILSTPTNLATDVVGMGVGAGGKVFNTGTKVVGMGVGAGGKVLNTGTNFVGGVVGGGVGAIGGGISAIGSGIRGIGRRDKGSDGLRSTSSRTPSPPQTMNMQQAYPVSGVAEPQQPLDSPENPLDKPKTAFDEKDSRKQQIVKMFFFFL
jgi:Ca2+-dependent lipid-binding protein